MDSHKALRKAQAARLLMEQSEIQEAFDIIIDNYKEALYLLESGDPEVTRVHSAIKSIINVRARLESEANSEKHHKNEIEARERYNAGQGH